MSDPLRKVNPGDAASRALRADTFNLMLDAAALARKVATGNNLQELPRVQPGATVFILAHDDLNIGSVIAIDSAAAWNPADDIQAAANQPVFNSAAPTTGQPVLIMLDATPSGEVGRAVISGAALVKIDYDTNGVQDYASAITGSTAELVTDASGAIPILLAESSGASRWAVVRIGETVATSSGGSLTTKNANGSHQKSTDTIIADQDTGIVFVGGAGNANELELIPASTTQTGTVTTANQSFGGTKNFANPIQVRKPIFVFSGGIGRTSYMVGEVISSGSAATDYAFAVGGVTNVVDDAVKDWFTGRLAISNDIVVSALTQCSTDDVFSPKGLVCAGMPIELAEEVFFDAGSPPSWQWSDYNNDQFAALNGAFGTWRTNKSTGVSTLNVGSDGTFRTYHTIEVVGGIVVSSPGPPTVITTLNSFTDFVTIVRNDLSTALISINDFKAHLDSM